MEGTTASHGNLSARQRLVTDLSPPTIFGAEDGGLGYNDLLESPSTEVTVTCPSYYFSYPAIAELLWDEDVIATETVQEGAQLVTFRFRGSRIAGTKFPGDDDRYTGDGVHEVWYRYRYTDSEDTSLRRSVRVKCAIPGGHDPVGETRDTNERLDAPTVIPSPIPDDPGVSVTVSFPAWRNIALGDSVTVHWSAVAFQLPPVDDIRNPPTLLLTRDELENAGGGGHVLVTYDIYDTVHNWSKYSPVTPVDVFLETPEAPWVEDTVGGAGAALRLGEISGDAVTIRVENHGGQSGTRIAVIWAPATGEPWHSTAQTVSRPNQPLTFLMPLAEANARTGTVTVNYERADADGSVVPSLDRALRVEALTGLSPVEVAEAADGTIRLGDLPPEGATLRAPHQSIIPAGTTLTFSWEGTDQQGQPVRGWTEGHSDGHTPTAARLPMADLQRIAGLIAIRYRAELPGGSLEAPWANFTVLSTAAWPAPSVAETGGTDTLTPHASRNGATVVIDADLVATDRVSATFGSYTTAQIIGGRPLRMTVPPGIVGRHLGQLIDVYYAVVRGATSQSAVLPLHVGTFSDGDAQLPVPRIDRADEASHSLDLATFAGDPNVLVAPWILIGIGQTVWLRIDGTRTDGGGDMLIIHSGQPVSQSMIGVGIEAAADRSRLMSWRNGSDIRVTCKVSFGGGSESSAIVFPTIVYRLKTTGSPVTGRANELEEFEDPTSVVANGKSYRLRFATIRPVGGRLQSSSTNLLPYLAGRHGYLNETTSVTATITFDHIAAAIRMGVRPQNPAFPTLVIAHDRDGNEIGRQAATQPGWVTFQSAGNSGIASLEVQTQTGQAASFDNLLMTTGATWDLKTPPVVETFDDLPLGSHGDHYEFERWYVNADGGMVAIENAPGGMSRQVLAIHLTPEGRVHQLTPQYAICPRIRVSLTLRSSATTSHRVTVSVLYINREDFTLRTVSKTVTLSQSAQRISFQAVGEVARDTEYVSHLRVVNQNNALITTVFYDDIQFE